MWLQVLLYPPPPPDHAGVSGAPGCCPPAPPAPSSAPAVEAHTGGDTKAQSYWGAATGHSRAFCPFHHRLMAPSSSVLVFYQKTENRGIQKNANRAGTRFPNSAFLRLLAGGLIWVKTKANAPFRPLHVWFMDLLRQRDNPFSSPV